MNDPQITLIGSGKVAHHFSHYLKLLNMPHQIWSRKCDPHFEMLQNVIEKSNRILLLISDEAIEEFIKKYIPNKKKIIIHFSGQLLTPHAYGLHPLMTFSKQLYDLKTYQSIPFIMDKGTPSLKFLLPGLPNSSYVIQSELKALYHSLCVMSGNFTCLLWQKLFDDFETKLKLPKETAMPFLKQIYKNLSTHAEDALTGPLERQDKMTISKNLHALQHDPYQKIYQSFVAMYQTKDNQ